MGWDVGAYKLQDTTSAVNFNYQPENITLRQSRPNPFSEFSIFNFQFSIAGYVSLKVYDVFGNEAATLVDGFMVAGSHQAVFEAGVLPPGVYYYTIQIGGRTESGKMVLVR